MAAGHIYKKGRAKGAGKSGRPTRRPNYGKPRSRRLGELIGDTLTPLCRKQGFASSDIIRYWGQIVGSHYADCSEPERIRWHRGNQEDGFKPGTLIIHCEGAQSLLMQQEAEQIIQRVNAYFGYPAIDAIKILQRPVSLRNKQKPEPLRPLTPAESRDLENEIGAFKNERMARALRGLGHAIKVRGD